MNNLIQIPPNKIKAIVVILVLLPGFLLAQIDMPPASPIANWTHQLGFSQIELHYSRPHRRGRKIFGKLVPYNVLWRTGAGESTRITFSEDIKFGSKWVKAGKYALYSIPGHDEWIVILNTDATLHGDIGYDDKKDALRIKVASQITKETYESFTIELVDFTPDYKASLELKWENTAIKIPICSNADSLIMDQIKENLIDATSTSPAISYRAALYYFTNNKDLSQALQWSQLAAKTDQENFNYIELYAKLLESLERYAEAITAGERALEIARASNSIEEIPFLEEKIKEWKHLAHLKHTKGGQ